MTKSMTEGNPLKLILNFTIPLLLGNLFQQTYNMVDAMIVGKCLGANALASVGASASTQFLVLGFCMGCCAGFAIPVAQQFGAREYSRMRSYIFHAILLTAAIALIMTTFCSVFCPQILHLMKTPDNIYKDAYEYLLILFLGIPFTLLYNLLAGILRAVGDSKTPFLFLVISTILNIALDLIFILIFHWGCAGAAAATITAQAISGILCLILIYKRFDILIVRPQERRFEGKILKRCLIMGIPMGLQYSITAIGSMVLQASNNSLGSVYISAFAAGSKLKQFAMCPFDALATAVSNFCSQNLGARQFDRIRKGLRTGMAIGVLYGLVMGLMLNLWGYDLSMLFVKAEETEVLKASALYVGHLGLFFWALGLLNNCRLAIQGIGFAGISIVSGILEMIARIAVSMIFVPKYGYTAITFADQCAWITACLYCVPLVFILINRCQRESDGHEIS